MMQILKAGLLCTIALLIFVGFSGLCTAATLKACGFHFDSTDPSLGNKLDQSAPLKVRFYFFDVTGENPTMKDPEAKVPATTMTFHLDYGDGESYEFTVQTPTEQGYFRVYPDNQFYHTYTKPGKYYPKLKVTDSTGSSVSPSYETPITAFEPYGVEPGSGLTITERTEEAQKTNEPLESSQTQGLRLTRIRGTVEVIRNGKLVTTSDIQPGDKIRTRRGSSATITFSDGSSLNLKENSCFEIVDMQNNKLSWGKIRAFLKLGLYRQYRVTTTVAVTAVRGTEFILEAAEDGTTTLTGLEGTVEFSDLDSRKTVVVEQYQTSVVKPGGTPSDPIPIDPNTVDRWWEREEEEGVITGLPRVEVAAIIAGVVLIGIVFAWKLKPKKEAEIHKKIPSEPKKTAELGAAFCAKCGAELPLGAEFCPKCGAKFSAKRSAYCAKCGTELPPDAEFCQDCGTKRG